MARPNRMRQIEIERGESALTLVPRILNEAGNIEAAAAELGISSRNLYEWCKANGIAKVTRQRIGEPDTSVTVYSAGDPEGVIEHVS